mmetsp:Transcript_35172/g.113427  ORF Transcript_35172/g.113427 Transcript_35172/m.113427 type:complete len:218 (-) Transcript_35172:452-1105(-)
MLRLRSCRHHVVDSPTRDSFDCDRDRVGSSVRCPQRLQRERSPLPPRRRRAQRRHYSQQQLPQGCSGRRPQVQLAQARCRRRSCKRSMEPPMMTSCGSAPSSVSSSSRRIGSVGRLLAGLSRRSLRARAVNGAPDTYTDAPAGWPASTLSLPGLGAHEKSRRPRRGRRFVGFSRGGIQRAAREAEALAEATVTRALWQMVRAPQRHARGCTSPRLPA